MTRSRPRRTTIWLSLILGVLGLVGRYHALPIVPPYFFWLMTAAWLLLIAGHLVESL